MTSGGPAASGSAPVTILGNGIASAHLAAASGETNFVGGFGSQLLFGGLGANILTYLAIGDGGDRVSAFDPAKDVINLSHMNTNITEAGLQNFTFIGTAPFSVGAQVRYRLNPTNDTTTVPPGRRPHGRSYHPARRTGAARRRQLRASRRLSRRPTWRIAPR